MTTKVSTTCTTTKAEPTELAMLFLCQKMFSLIDTTGELSTTFDLNGHKIAGSCGVTFRNEYFIFGGSPKAEVQNSRRILQLQDCGLIQINSDLSFDHRSGPCGSTNEVIILCFNNDDPDDFKRCRQSSSPSGQWNELTFSTYSHHATAIAPSPGTE